MPYVAPYYETCCGDDDEHAEQVSRRTAREYANGANSIPDVKLCKFISLHDLNLTLANWLPRPGGPEATRAAVIRSAVFQRISEILVQYGKGEWSLRPRLFSLLRMLDCEQGLLDCFVREGLMDSALPFTQSTLPSFVVGTSLRSRLLALQKVVLYKKEDELVALEEGGRHVHLGGSGDDYFHSIDSLGSGGSAYVDHVFSRRTGKRYARKRVYRGQSPLQDEKVLQQLERELQALKRLHHRHIVTLKGSYTDPHCVALIMTPVAEMNLREYFVDAKIDNNLRCRSLRCFFGCLATALAYLHEQNIRHNDIKPQNILVAKGSVYLTDFGTSRAWNTEEKSETRGRREGYTPRYSAPETHDTGTRNRAADIFSLGCVFMDMATILHGHSIEQMANFFEDNGSMRSDAIWANLAATKLWLESLCLNNKSGLAPEVVKLISDMLRRDPEERPTAAQVRGRLMDSSGDDILICPHCSSPGGMLPTQKALAENHIKDKEPLSELEADEYSKPVTAAYLNLQERTVEVKTMEALPSPESTAKKETPAIALNGAEQGPQIVSSPGPAHQTSRTPKSVRFGALPEDRRPVPTEPTLEVEQPDQVEAFVRPEQVRPPPFRQHDIHPLPSATLLPSYILAGTNHFQQAEITVAARSSPSESNLFVYGRLMFPTVLHALAVASQKGVYSPELRRRLHPSSADWAKADLSIKHTTQIMTPACLRGYDRWKPRGLNCAVLQDSRLTKKVLERQRDMGIITEPAVAEPPGKVVGFLILGVRSDALRFCDLIFGGDRQTLRKMKVPTGEKLETKPPANLLHRRAVDVDIELGDGELALVSAQTYVWTDGIADLDGPWEEDRFLRSSAVQSLLKDNPPWLEQERTLATAMQVSMALVGDYLCGAISAGSIQDLAVLLRNGFDANAPCRIYGFPLQAAVSLGREDMVRLLLDHGAVVNASGGQFGTPLIAAAYGSRKSIMKLLLHREADVFASDTVHVDALFQAVAHNDYAATELLLEHGAWLSKAWKEATDMAEELPDDEILTLLGQYDVKKKRLEYLERTRNDRDDADMDDQMTSIVPAYVPSGDAIIQLLSNIKLSGVGMAVLLKFPRAAKMSGSWRGRRGVELTMAALNADAPMELLLEAIRQMVHPVRVMRRILTQYDQERDLANNDSEHAGPSKLRAGVDGRVKAKDDYDSADDDSSENDAHSRPPERRGGKAADSPQPGGGQLYHSTSHLPSRPSMTSASSGRSYHQPRAPTSSTSPRHRNPRPRRSRSRSPDPRRRRASSQLEVPRAQYTERSRGYSYNEGRWRYQGRE